MQTYICSWFKSMIAVMFLLETKFFKMNFPNYFLNWKFLVIILIPQNFLFNKSNGFLAAAESNFPHILNLPNGLQIKWRSDNPDWITFEIFAPTKGYIGIGFSKDGKMNGSDIHICWVDSEGRGHVKDLYSGQTTRELYVDSSQDLELIRAKEDEQGTSITYRRRWVTCDNMDFPITEDTMRLIWAWNDDDPMEYLDGTMKLLPYREKDNAKRGVRSVFMKTRPQSSLFPDEEPIYPENVKHFDFTVSNIVVPKSEAYHHCRIIKFPKLSRKHHVVAYRPKIEGTSSKIVYQINLYRCDNVGPSVFDKYVDYPGQDCYSSETPSEWYNHCTELRITLSLGSEGEILPNHLGFPLKDSDVYYLLETHYVNPDGHYVLDSSGIRVFYSSKLRRYDSGLMITGHRRSSFLSIPPKQKDFSFASLCSAHCTSNGIRPEGIKIISVLLRTHLTGREIVLRHVRNGKELPKIVYDRNYDYNYQNYRRLQKEIMVLPGDDLITECTFDTSLNKTFIFGGISPQNEACEAAIIYYPKSALMDCRSEPELYGYLQAMGIIQDSVTGEDKKNVHTYPIDRIVNTEENFNIFKQVLIKSPKGVQSRFLDDYITTLNWNDDYFAKTVEQKWRTGLHSTYCHGTHGQRINVTKIIEFPKFIEHLKLPLEDHKCFQLLNGVNKTTSNNVLYYLFCYFVLLLFNSVNTVNT